jgi:CheY-like chemotaxis protein
MERQIQHLTRIIDDLLDVSRINTGKVAIQPERLDLARLVRQSLDDYGGLLNEAGLKFALEAPETPVWVSGDPARLAQVLTNLLDNSCKFTPHGGRVTVRLATDAERHQAIITVSDTGIGIDAATLPHVFDVFSQGDHSLDRSRGGLGLGLSVVRSLVQLHGGTVEASSQGTGQGAELRICLPQEPEPPALVTSPLAAKKQRNRRRVLVVEDNRDAAESLRTLLEVIGHDVTVAYTGPQGVLAARQVHPDAIVSDIGLPGMDGLALAATLRGDPSTSHARLIAVTGYSREEDRRRSREAGFDYFLVKPVDPRALETILATCGGVEN